MEKAIEIIRQDHQQIRQMVGLPADDHQLDGEKIVRLRLAFNRRWPPETKEDNPYIHYEFGHLCIREHVIQELGRSLEGGLDEKEEQVVRHFIGRIFNNPPPRERRKILDALKTLRSMGNRGQQIWKALQDQATRMRAVVREATELSTGEIQDGRWERQEDETTDQWRERIRAAVEYIERPEHYEALNAYSDQFANPFNRFFGHMEKSIEELIAAKEKSLRNRISGQSHYA